VNSSKLAVLMYNSRYMKEILRGFRDFIVRGNVVDLAVAVAVGGAFTAIVNALVKDLITPLIAAIGGQPDFSQIQFTINNSQFMIGDFLNALVSFLIMASVIYFGIVLPMNRLTKKIKAGEKVDPAEKSCEECLSMIPLKAKRCKFCTAVQKNK
jgi:large conductance mechanosensitive channel